MALHMYLGKVYHVKGSDSSLFYFLGKKKYIPTEMLFPIGEMWGLLSGPVAVHGALSRAA